MLADIHITLEGVVIVVAILIALYLAILIVRNLLGR